MFWLGLLTSTAFFPLFTHGATTPRWIVLAIGIPVMLCATYPIPWSIAHTVLAVFLTWATLSLTWASSFYDGMTALGLWALIGGAFLLGSSRQNTVGLFKGLALGIGVSSAVALVQWFGFKPWHEWASPGGLFGNRNMLAEAAALTLIGCATFRLWRFAPLCILPLFISTSRTAWLAIVAAGLLWLWEWNRWLFATMVAALIIASPLVVKIDIHSADQRRVIWTDTLQATTPLGAGVGSFMQNYPAFASVNTLYERPEEVHNDYLQVAYELGLPGALLFASFLLLCLITSAPERFVFVALMMEMFLAFPLHLPTTTLVFGVMAGRCARDWRYVWLHLARRRGLSFSRPAFSALGLGTMVQRYSPVEPDVPKDTGSGVNAKSNAAGVDTYRDAEFNRWSNSFRSELERLAAGQTGRLGQNFGFKRGGD